MIVVSNTSPIFYLSTIGHLDLLRQLYGEIVISTTVFNEITDERLGRAVAMRVGIQVTGVLGILIAAKQNNLIQEVKPLVDALVEQAGFWINVQLYAEVLQVVGE